MSYGMLPTTLEMTLSPLPQTIKLGMQDRVDLVGWLHTKVVYPPEGGHPSQQ